VNEIIDIIKKPKVKVTKHNHRDKVIHIISLLK